jgi:hypothetical protein
MQKCAVPTDFRRALRDELGEPTDRASSPLPFPGATFLA